MAHPRTYETTHPWISFVFDLSRIDPRFHLAVGEAHGHLHGLRAAPLNPAFREKLTKLCLIRGALASTRIEGNTLTEEEARKVYDGTAKMPKSREYLAREFENVARLCDEIAGGRGTPRPAALTPVMIREFNARILDGVPVAEGAHPGRLRGHSVGVGRYRAPPPQDVELLVDRLCTWLDGPDFRPPEDLARHILFPFGRAAIAHLYFEWIHPFGDGNGRTGRMIELYVLVASGVVPPVAAHTLSNHYNATRTEYYRRLEESVAADGVARWLRYAAAGFAAGLLEQSVAIAGQHQVLAWRDFARESLNVSDGPSRRRFELASRLPGDRMVSEDDLLSSDAGIASLYGRVSRKTLQRDLAELLRLGLAVRTSAGWRRHVEVLAPLDEP